MHLAIVLLHYNNIKVTELSISYIKKMKGGQSLNIVVVDNNSPNKSGEVLGRLFSDDSYVHIIMTNENLGFAKGNNLGYLYAKKILQADTIIIMNSDVFIKDYDFINKIETVQKKISSELIAPDIIGKRENHQNPFRYKTITNKKLRTIYYYNKIVNTIYKIPLVNFVLAFFLDHKKQKPCKFKNCIIQHIVPHGACIIYMKSWVSKEDIAFIPETFMYLEEDFLGDYMAKKNYNCTYIPYMKVYHLEDASTDSALNKSIRKRIFISENLKKSASTLIRMRTERE